MFDFYQRYQHYTIAELVNIVEHPSLYQRAAVEAAARLLTERQPSETELLTAREIVAEEDVRAAVPHRWDQLRTHVTAAIRYLFLPSSTFDPQKWLYWLCIALGIQACWSLQREIRYILLLIRCRDCSVGLELFPFAIDWVFGVLLVALLLLRKKTGWILAVFYAGVQCLLLLLPVLNYWAHGVQFWTTIIISTGIYAGVLYFFARPAVMELFGASRTLFHRALTAAAVVGLLLVVLLQMQA